MASKKCGILDGENLGLILAVLKREKETIDKNRLSNISMIESLKRKDAHADKIDEYKKMAVSAGKIFDFQTDIVDAAERRITECIRG